MNRKIEVMVDADILCKVLTVVELIVNFRIKESSSRKRSKDIYSLSVFKSVEKKKTKSLGRKCENLVINSIANHRYKEASTILWLLCQDKAVFSQFIYKVGITVLSNLEYDGKRETILKFFRYMMDLKKMDKKETQLEFIIYALRKDLQNIHTSLQELSSRTMKHNTDKHDKIDSIYTAYTLLLDYLKWDKVAYGNVVLPQSQTNRDVMTSAFKRLLSTSGEWDIFVLKLLMVMLIEEEDTVEEVLLKFLDKNQDNINAYIYLCSYLYHYKPESKNFLKYLEILADKSPSDVRVLWLINILNKSDGHEIRCLNYIFMFLDYPVNGSNVFAWQMLWENLSKIVKKRDENRLKIVNKFWKYRLYSWKWMYFNTERDSCINLNDELLILNKIAVLSLLSDDLQYSKKMSEKFPGILEKVKLMIENT